MFFVSRYVVPHLASPLAAFTILSSTWRLPRWMKLIDTETRGAARQYLKSQFSKRLFTLSSASCTDRFIVRQIHCILQIWVQSDMSVQCREVALIGQRSITGAFQLVASISAGVNWHAQVKSMMDLCHFASDQRVAPRMLWHFKIFFFTKCNKYMRKYLKNLFKRPTCFCYLAMA